ncbi:MAG TPA: hypothetical protein K8V63_05300 [Brevibacterium linens]|nr:hypothetical protein [Brevibacterium linens]
MSPNRAWQRGHGPLWPGFVRRQEQHMIREDRTVNVLTLTIDNTAQANALTEEMLGQLTDAFTEASANEICAQFSSPLPVGADSRRNGHRAVRTYECGTSVRDDQPPRRGVRSD